MASSVAGAWERIEQWLAAKAPEVLDNLAGPASEQELAARERALGVALPDEFAESYRLHNGQRRDVPGLTEMGWLLPLKEAVAQRRVWKELLDGGHFVGVSSEPDVGVRDDWWSPKWIPFTHDGGGNHLCIDLDPAPGGSVGQVILMWHDDPRRELRAGSFGGWLSEFAARLERGELVYSEEYGGIVPADQA
jgi:cell wall assembly regulator SMI1